MPPKSSKPADVASWIDSDFAGSFRNDADPARWPNNADGNFAIPMLTLAHVNATAGLVRGTASAGTVDTFNFIRKWLGRKGAPSAKRYKSRAALVYALFRHGLVHAREPGQLIVTVAGKKVELVWQINRQHEGGRDDHLRLEEIRREKGGKRRRLRLIIDTDYLYEDLLGALAAIRERVLLKKSFCAKVYRGARRAGRPHPPDRHETHLAKELLRVDK